MKSAALVGSIAVCIAATASAANFRGDAELQSKMLEYHACAHVTAEKWAALATSEAQITRVVSYVCATQRALVAKRILAIYSKGSGSVAEALDNSDEAMLDIDGDVRRTVGEAAGADTKSDSTGQ